MSSEFYLLTPMLICVILWCDEHLHPGAENFTEITKQAIYVFPNGSRVTSDGRRATKLIDGNCGFGTFGITHLKRRFLQELMEDGMQKTIIDWRVGSCT